MLNLQGKVIYWTRIQQGSTGFKKYLFQISVGEGIAQCRVVLFNGQFSVLHCVKGVQIRGFFRSVFYCIRTGYRDLQSKSPYSVRIQENTDQEKLCIWTLFTTC